MSFGWLVNVGHSGNRTDSHPKISDTVRIFIAGCLWAQDSDRPAT